MPFELVAKPIPLGAYILGEGALWDWRAQKLRFVDIDSGNLNALELGVSGKESISSTKVGNVVTTVVCRQPEKSAGLIVALEREIAVVDEKTGKVAHLCDVPEPPTNRMNDGKCDPSGRFWFGSMAYDFRVGAGSLYMLDAGCQLYKMLDGVTISNGIVWTKAMDTMYYIDSENNAVESFAFDAASGAIKNRRTVVENIWGGIFDGMTIDSDDNLLIATWKGSAVLKIDPRSRELLGKIRVPGALNVTSCALGGSELRTLFITTAAKDSDPSSYPDAGKLFVLQDTGLSSVGLPAFEFAG
ncbi:MAG TPA: SMP-30/gluconolactonase/LRE family protein [Oculatellaceae cyanobacterium]